MNHFKKFIFSLSQKVNYISNGALVLMTVLICANVILRSIFRKPIEGTEEIVGLLAGIVISCALAHTTVQKGHIAIDIISFDFSKFVQKTVRITVYALSVIIFAVAGFFTGKSATHKMIMGEVTQGLEIPDYPIVYGISFGCFVMSLVLLIQLFDFMKNGSKRMKENPK